MRFNDLSIFLSKFLTAVHITTSDEGVFYLPVCNCAI